MEISGRAAHAGLRPEHGISATMVAARALAQAESEGWWGRIVRPNGRGTANVGRWAGRDGGAAGGATNVVTDYVVVDGEARSHDPAFLWEIVLTVGVG